MPDDLLNPQGLKVVFPAAFMADPRYALHAYFSGGKIWIHLCEAEPPRNTESDLAVLTCSSQYIFAQAIGIIIGQKDLPSIIPMIWAVIVGFGHPGQEGPQAVLNLDLAFDPSTRRTPAQRPGTPPFRAPGALG